MHFGKRTEPATLRIGENDGNDGTDTSNELDTSSYSNGAEPEPNNYDENPFRVMARSPRTRYFIPHAFIGKRYDINWYDFLVFVEKKKQLNQTKVN